MALENSKDVLWFANDCHAPDSGKFCSDGRALATVTGNVSLSDVEKNYPERVGSMNRTVAAIGSVHGMPSGFPQVKVEIWSEMGGAQGAYNQGEHLIKIGEDAGKFQASTLAHEFGHHLTLGENGEGKMEFYSKLMADPELKAWHNAVKATPQFKHFADIEGSVTASSDSRDYASYLKDPRELFARSYSQWVGVRSGNETLIKQNEVLRGKADGMYQWSQIEFEPIGKAMDDWFAKKGWLR